MNNAQASCVITVDVTSSTLNANCAATPASHTNGAANIGGTARLTNSATTSCLTVQSLPSLNKAFGTNPIGVGQVSTLTFTLTNPAGSPARTNLTFSDAFTAGVVIAATPNVVNNCGGAPTVTAAAGGNTFAIGGSGVNAAVGPRTFTASLDLTSASANGYFNAAANVTVG